MSVAFENAGPRSVILAADSQRVFSLWYQAYWYRKDIHRQFPDRVPPEPPSGFDARVDVLIAHNLDVTPVFAAFRTGILDRFQVVENGVIYRIDAPR